MPPKYTFSQPEQQKRSGLDLINQSLSLMSYFKKLKNADKPTYQMMGDKLIQIDKNTGQANIVKDFMTQGANWATVKGDFEGVANALLMNKGADAFLNDKGKYDSNIAYGYLLNSDELKDVLNSPRQRPYVNQMKLLLRKKALDLPRASSEKAWTELERFMQGNNVHKGIIDMNIMKRENLQRQLNKVQGLSQDKILLQYGGKTFNGQPIMPTEAWKAEIQGYENEIKKLIEERSFLTSVYNYNANLKSISTNLNDMYKNFKHINVDIKPIQDYISSSLNSEEIGIINEGIEDIGEKFPDINIQDSKKTEYKGQGIGSKALLNKKTENLKSIFPHLLDNVYFERQGDDRREWNSFIKKLKGVSKGVLPKDMFKKDIKTSVKEGVFKGDEFIPGKDITFRPEKVQEFVTGKKSIIDEPLMEFELPPTKSSLGKNTLMDFNLGSGRDVYEEALDFDTNTDTLNILKEFGAPDSILGEFEKQDSLNQIINILNK